jgi:protein-L-isoaspartate O-methyltransferase
MIDRHLGARTRLATHLADEGHLPDPVWQAAFAQVPRHLFVPRFFLPTPDGRWQPVDAGHPDYLGSVYADTTLTTQLDGAIDPMPGRGPVAGVGTSSSTQPSLMAFMLHALQLTGDERVLEVGTASAVVRWYGSRSTTAPRRGSSYRRSAGSRRCAPPLR